MKTINRKSTKDNRIHLRKEKTDAEKKLWGRLRNKRFQNLKFYRQQGIGNYIADFCCPEKKIVIELDGSQHFEETNREYDHKRTEYFENLGIRVIRFTNFDVMINMDVVLEHLYCLIEKPDDVMEI